MQNASEAAPGYGATDDDRGLTAFVRRHGLVSFYALAYGLADGHYRAGATTPWFATSGCTVPSPAP